MSYDALGTGSVDDPSGFSGTTQFDSTSTTPFSNNDSDSGSQNFTTGKSLPGGGTKIQGNVIQGGRIISDTTTGRGDYRRNDPAGYDKWMTETGRSLQNPYGNQGLFTKVFGAKNINYNLDPTTAQNILDAGFKRFSDFTGQDELSQKRAFGSLFGSPEGEMTAQGEVRKQVTPMSTGEIAGRLASTVMGMGPLVSMLPGGNVGYAPMGGGQYSPQLDPQVNKDLASSGIMNALTGGADLSGLGQTLKDKFLQAEDVIKSAFTPPEVAAQQNKAAGPIPTFDPRGPDAMSQNMLQQKVPTAAEEIQTMNLSQSAPQRADVAAMLAGMDRASQSTAPTSQTAQVYNVDSTVLEGLREAGGGYKVDDIQDMLDRGYEATFDSTTGKAQLSKPGSSRGLSYDLSRELGIKTGPDLENFIENLQGQGMDVIQDRSGMTGSGDLREGPAFMKVSDASDFAPGIRDYIMNFDNPLQTEIGGGTLEFKPEGGLKQGLTGGTLQYNRPFQNKDMGIGNIFRIFG
ncbi:MAG: hypothetical protein VXA34_00060 [Gammaproteobacteria bacterium]